MKRILKSSAIMGGSSAVSVLAGIIKAKVIAISIGPKGVGIMEMLVCLMGIASTVSGLGLSGSGVREVAFAREQNNVSSLFGIRRVSLCTVIFLGSLSAILIFWFRYQIAQYLLNNRSYSWAIGWLGVGVFASTLSGVLVAYLNGFRRISSMAWITIWAAIISAAAGSLAVWGFGSKGVIIVVISYPITTLMVSLWYVVKIKMPRVHIAWREYVNILRSLLTLGFVTMIASLMAVGTQFLTRWLINRNFGIGAVGYFGAAWNISMVYLGFALGSFAVDYYPSLSEVATDDNRFVERINKQVYAAMLLTVPVILGMYIIAPYMVNILYSAAFRETTEILRWQLLGDLFKVPAWALGFALLAQRRSIFFLATELIWNVVYLAILWLGLERWGLKVAGVAFLLAYISYFFLIWIILKHKVKFSWNSDNIKLMGIFGGCAVSIIILPSLFLYGWIVQLSIIIGLMLFSFNKIKLSLSRGLPWKL